MLQIPIALQAMGGMTSASAPGIASASAAIAQTFPLLQSLPLGPAAWIPLALAAALLVFGVAALVYMIGSIVNSPTAKSWSRMQIFEALLSIIMIFLFASLSFLFMLNATNAYSSASLLPKQCVSASNIFALSMCDLGNFNSDAGTYFLTVYDFAAALGSADPVLSLNLQVSPLIKGIGATGSTDILPKDFETMLGILSAGIITMLLLNQVQMVLLSGSLLFLSFFLVLGLVARTLGFSRRFGGAMIAFGLGLGFVYPLITTLTYGFIDVSLTPTSAVTTLLASAGGAAAFLFAPTSAAGLAFSEGLGYVIAGLTFIPFLNFMILEAFIVDFSSSIGEKVSFMSLLGSLV